MRLRPSPARPRPPAGAAVPGAPIHRGGDHREGEEDAGAEEHRGGQGRVDGGALQRSRYSGEGASGWANEWNEGGSVDVVGGGEVARVGWNQAETEAAMEDRGEFRRDVVILVTK